MLSFSPRGQKYHFFIRLQRRSNEIGFRSKLCIYFAVYHYLDNESYPHESCTRLLLRFPRAG